LNATVLWIVKFDAYSLLFIGTTVGDHLFAYVPAVYDVDFVLLELDCRLPPIEVVGSVRVANWAFVDEGCSHICIVTVFTVVRAAGDHVDLEGGRQHLTVVAHVLTFVVGIALLLVVVLHFIGLVAVELFRVIRGFGLTLAVLLVIQQLPLLILHVRVVLLLYLGLLLLRLLTL